MAKEERRSGLLWPLFLIGLGVIFLLNNLGMTELSAWELLLHYWPLLLIAGGVDILFLRRGGWGTLLAAFLILAVLVGGVYLLETRAFASKEVDTIRQSGAGLERAQVVLNPAAGSLHLAVLKDGGADLLRGEVARGFGGRIVQTFDDERDPPRFELGHEGWVSVPPMAGWGSQWSWNLRLDAEVETALDVDMGAGVIDLDLRGLSLESVETNLGVGQIVLTLPERGQFEVRIESGVGDSLVVIPPGMQARISLDTALVQVNLPDGYIEVDEDTFVTPGFEGAQNRVELDIEQAIGSVRVR